MRVLPEQVQTGALSTYEQHYRDTKDVEGALSTALAEAYDAGWRAGFNAPRPKLLSSWPHTEREAWKRVQVALHEVAQVSRLPCGRPDCHRHVDCLAQRVEEALEGSRR